MTTAADLEAGRPLVFRNATVLTMDDGHRVLAGADVLITGERIAAVGPNLQVPDGTAEIDATGGIVMPGMIDTHRHMWQTAMRAYGADWTLTQYFVWYYLNWGKKFRPQDVYAGNLLAAIESIDAGRDDHGGLVARAADDRPRRSRHRRPGGGARAVRPGLREHPAGLVGVEHHAGVPGLLRPAVRRQGRHAGVRDRLRHPR